METWFWFQKLTNLQKSLMRLRCVIKLYVFEIMIRNYLVWSLTQRCSNFLCLQKETKEFQCHVICWFLSGGIAAVLHQCGCRMISNCTLGHCTYSLPLPVVCYIVCWFDCLPFFEVCVYRSIATLRHKETTASLSCLLVLWPARKSCIPKVGFAF